MVRRPQRQALILGLLAALSVALAAGSAAGPAAEQPVVSRQQARIAGRSLAYTAEIGRIAIRDVATGGPQGFMGYVAYRVAAKGQPRPVMFIWNGGPGANSSLLHFSTAGPRRVDGASLVDNEDSWLSSADLVFVDPVGTGFSRPAKPEYAQQFYGTRGDVASVTEFVGAWLLAHDADDAPVYLVGESWGAGRAANVSHALLKRGRRVDGIVLISGGWSLNTQYAAPALLDAMGVVDMATAALHHGRTAPELGSDPVSLRRAADAWVREVYAPALARAAELTEPERDPVAPGLARFTGLAPSRIDRKTLRISPRQFRTELLADQGKAAYVFDLRRTAPPEETGKAAMLRYLRRDLGYRPDLPYLGLEPATEGYAASGIYPEGPGAHWDYATADVSPEERRAAMAAAMASGSGPPKLGPPLPGTVEALGLNPRLKVLVAAGLYDSFLACASGAEIERQLPPALRQSIRFKCYAGGHAMYLDAPARAELARDMREFVSARP